MSDAIPSHYSSEKNAGYAIIGIGALVSIILLVHTVQLAPILAWASVQPYNAQTWETVTSAFGSYYNPKMTMMGFKAAWNTSATSTIIATVLMFMIGLFPLLFAKIKNPHRLFDLHHGDARYGRLDDVAKMESRRQVGIKGGRFLHLGLWPRTDREMKLIETLSVLVLAPPGTGKCLAPHEPVLMYDGTIRRTGDLRAGDLLMGPDGKPRRVIKTNPGRGPMYRVTPNKGRPYECNGDHILSLRCSKAPRHGSKKPERGDIAAMTVAEWLDLSLEQKGKWKQWRAAVDFAHAPPLPLDPYLVGVLLGDGTTTAKIGIHSADPEMAELAYATAGEYGLTVREERKTGSQSVYYGISAGNTKGLPRKGKNPLLNLVVASQLQAPCDRKSIPHQYKTSSRQERLQLLAGLIDTDGHYDKRCNVFDFVSKSEQLVEDIAFVARSLGFAAYLKPCDKICTNNGVTGTYYRIGISGDIAQIPTRLARKQARSRAQSKQVTNTGFNIEAIGEGDYYGIIIESTDPTYNHAASCDTPADQHLYLLDDFTVTHNTATFVVPSIVDSDDTSFIVNDPKPELFNITSGYRASIGPVYMINWSATDKVPDKIANEPELINDPTQTIFYPRFNPISPQLLPPEGTAERDTYLDAIANVLSPASGKGGNSDYFEQKGRAALVGFLHYICSKVADKQNDEGLPPQWQRGDGVTQLEPSIPMLIDLVTEGIRLAADANEKAKQKAAEEGKFHSGDALTDWLRNIVTECADMGYNPRSVTELTQLVTMAPNERSGILGTMDKAFLPFKNAAVRERTMSCDFVPADLRGMKDPVTGEWRPVTLYVCANQAEAAAFATITALLYEVLSREYLAYGPGEVNRNHVKLGPYPVCFMLDEFAKLPRIEAVMTGPDLGRSKKTMYCLVAQADAQIAKLYSAEDKQIIYSTTAVKYILPQNDKDTVKLVQDMVGPTTIKRFSSSRSKGGDFKEWGKSNQSTNIEKVDFIRAGDVSGMKPGTHMLICQGFMNRPYLLDSVFYFKREDMVEKTSMPPAYPVPEHIRQKRIAEYKARNPGIFETTEVNRVLEEA